MARPRARRRPRRRTATIGTRTPGRNSARSPTRGTFVIRRYGSGNSSASRPNPGMLAVQPQSAGSNSSRSIWSVSPGSAPSTAIGPLTWSTRSKSRRPKSSYRRLGAQLAAGGVEQVELDQGAAIDGLDRRDRGIPGQVEPIARDVDRGCRRHRRTLSSRRPAPPPARMPPPGSARRGRPAASRT